MMSAVNPSMMVVADSRVFGFLDLGFLDFWVLEFFLTKNIFADEWLKHPLVASSCAIRMFIFIDTY
jgi:hypothetical protein